VADRKYSAASIGSRIDEFLKTTCRNGGYKLNYEIKDSELSGDDFETPDVMVKFSGADVDLLLSNRAELLLALEHLTMEMLRVSSDDHSRISFDANDYRLLRIEELRISAAAAADKVKRTGMPFRFNPMNSRERRLLHMLGETEADAAEIPVHGAVDLHQLVHAPGDVAVEPLPVIHAVARVQQARGQAVADGKPAVALQGIEQRHQVPRISAQSTFERRIAQAAAPRRAAALCPPYLTRYSRAVGEKAL